MSAYTACRGGTCSCVREAVLTSRGARREADAASPRSTRVSVVKSFGLHTATCQSFTGARGDGGGGGAGGGANGGAYADSPGRGGGFGDGKGGGGGGGAYGSIWMSVSVNHTWRPYASYALMRYRLLYAAVAGLPSTAMSRIHGRLVGSTRNSTRPFPSTAVAPAPTTCQPLRPMGVRESTSTWILAPPMGLTPSSRRSCR